PPDRPDPPDLSELHELTNLHRAFLIDRVSGGDARQARHRAGARAGELQVIGNRDVAEDEVAQDIVAAAVPAGGARNLHLRALAEVLDDVHLGFFTGIPRLP